MTRTLALAALLPLAACGSDSASGDAPAPQAPVADAPPDTLAQEAPSEEWPLAKAGTIRVEGTEQPTTLTLVREEDFPIPFATYRPEGMTSDWGASDEGAGAHFFLGDATLTIFVPSRDPGDLAAWASETAESMGEPSQLDAFPRWVDAAYSFGGVDVTGSVRAGRHNGRAFYVLETMPLEMGDGFAPRAETVLREWRWLDTGTGFGE